MRKLVAGLALLVALPLAAQQPQTREDGQRRQRVRRSSPQRLGRKLQGEDLLSRGLVQPPL
jgi:hypothetical protein